MNVVYWLLKTSVSALPGAALLWVNQLFGFFKNSPHIALREWRADADSTAAALGSLIVVILAIGVSLIPWRWLRWVLALAFLLATAFAVWKCYGFFTLLDTVRMSETAARQIQDEWRNWYITMLCSFVAAMTCALTTMWSGGSKNGGGAGKPGGSLISHNNQPAEGNGHR